MDLYYLENLSLKVTINRSGAELVRILNKENGKNFEDQVEEFWKNEEGNRPSDNLIAKDIFCDRFAQRRGNEPGIRTGFGRLL